jgi:flagellar biosynthetic protein FliP
MDELSLAAWADPYGGSLAAQVYTVAPTQAPIRSQHGLYFVPDYAATTAPHFDRFIVPDGADGRWAYTSSLRDLARDQGDVVASAQSRLLFLATAPGQSASSGVPLDLLLGAPALGLLGAGFVYGLGRLRRRAARPSRLRRVAGGAARFALHFGEMVVAMYVGMVALGALNAQVLVPLAHIDLTGPTLETQTLAMGVFMGLPMAAWMLIRGHGRRHAVEMAAAMFVPFAGAVALHVVGLLPRGAMMGIGSDLMWLAMVGVMLPHWRHYAGGTHAHCTPAAAPATATLAPTR